MSDRFLLIACRYTWGGAQYMILSGLFHDFFKTRQMGNKKKRDPPRVCTSAQVSSLTISRFFFLAKTAYTSEKVVPLCKSNQKYKPRYIKKYSHCAHCAYNIFLLFAILLLNLTKNSTFAVSFGITTVYIFIVLTIWCKHNKQVLSNFVF